MIVLINIVLLLIMVTVKIVFFADIPARPNIAATANILSIIVSIVMLAEFTYFCVKRKISIRSLTREIVNVVFAKDSLLLHLRKYYIPITVVALLGSALSYRPDTNYFYGNFASDALTLAILFVGLYTLRYLIVNLKMRLLSS